MKKPIKPKKPYKNDAPPTFFSSIEAYIWDIGNDKIEVLSDDETIALARTFSSFKEEMESHKKSCDKFGDDYSEFDVAVRVLQEEGYEKLPADNSISFRRLKMILDQVRDLGGAESTSSLCVTGGDYPCFYVSYCLPKPPRVSVKEMEKFENRFDIYYVAMEEYDKKIKLYEAHTKKSKKKKLEAELAKLD